MINNTVLSKSLVGKAIAIGLIAMHNNNIHKSNSKHVLCDVKIGNENFSTNRYHVTVSVYSYRASDSAEFGIQSFSRFFFLLSFISRHVTHYNINGYRHSTIIIFFLTTICHMMDDFFLLLRNNIRQKKKWPRRFEIVRRRKRIKKKNTQHQRALYFHGSCVMLVCGCIVQNEWTIF